MGADGLAEGGEAGCSSGSGLTGRREGWDGRMGGTMGLTGGRAGGTSGCAFDSFCGSLLISRSSALKGPWRFSHHGVTGIL